LFGGLGQNGTDSTPHAAQDCLNNSAFQGSATAQGACITGATAGQSYLSAKNGTSSSSNNLNNSSGSLQDILDQSKNLSKYLDSLHAVGPNSNVNLGGAADNNYGSYVNGAGKQQALNVYKATTCTSNCPALLWFNGGGWHMDDGTAYCLATGAAQKNCVPGGGSSAAYDGGTSSGPLGPPPGGGANQRGWTVIEVTYRLGSSGVYYMLEDVLRGIQHVRNNAGLYGIDASRIAIGGDSAGGSLSLRAGTTGKTGAKVMVGWSAPTNAYTALFKSFSSFLIGMDHSTCIPTDLAGITNITDLLNGGSGNVAKYGQGLSSNDFSGLGIGGSPGGGAGGDPLGLITQVLTAGQYAAKTSQNAESITQQLQSGGIQGMSGSLINLSAKKLGECLDNFNTLSPALFASASSPPGLLADFDDDAIIDVSQSYQMRDKLLGLGVESKAVILQGDPEAAANAPAIGAGDNHLGYDPRFVCPTINFLDHIVNKGNQPVDCATGAGGTQQSSGCAVNTTISIKPSIRGLLTVATSVSGSGDTSAVGSGTDAQHLTGTGNTGLNGSDPTQLHYLNGGSDTIQHEVAPSGSGGGSSGGSGGGSGSGSGGGGASCASNAPAPAPGGQGAPSPSSSPSSSPAAGSSGSSGSSGGSGNNGSNQGNLGGQGGIGGSSGSTSSSTGTDKSGTPIDTGSDRTINSPLDGTGSVSDATGPRGGAVFNNSVGGSGKASDLCEVDYSRAPDLAQNAKAMLQDCNSGLAKIESYLNPTLHAHPLQILFVPDSQSDAYNDGGQCTDKSLAFAVASAGRIYVCADPYRAFVKNFTPGDGMILHEATHLTQNYVAPGYSNGISVYSAPFWVQEGMADFMRYSVLGLVDTYVPTGVKVGASCDSNSTYLSGYGCSAAFLSYIVRAYNPNVAKNVQKAANSGNYTDSVVTQGTGKSIDQLYNECLSAECKGGKSL
jgi:hypothetical protein